MKGSSTPFTVMALDNAQRKLLVAILSNAISSGDFDRDDVKALYETVAEAIAHVDETFGNDAELVDET